MERFAEDASLLEKLRNFLKQEATLSARVIAGKEEEGAKFRDYFEHDEPLKACRRTAPWRFSAAATKAFSAPR
jgi:uncharacterized protein